MMYLDLLISESAGSQFTGIGAVFGFGEIWDRCREEDAQGLVEGMLPVGGIFRVVKERSVVAEEVLLERVFVACLKSPEI